MKEGNKLLCSTGHALTKNLGLLLEEGDDDFEWRWWSLMRRPSVACLIDVYNGLAACSNFWSSSTTPPNPLSLRAARGRYGVLTGVLPICCEFLYQEEAEDVGRACADGWKTRHHISLEKLSGRHLALRSQGRT